MGASCKCQGERWVCEEHPSLPFPHDDCPGPGIPCSCNPKEEMPPGTTVLHERGPMRWTRLRRVVLWIALRVPLGGLNPRLIAFGLGAKSYKEVCDTKATPNGKDSSGNSRTK